MKAGGATSKKTAAKAMMTLRAWRDATEGMGGYKKLLLLRRLAEPEQIKAMDTAMLLKMDVGKFALLRERADAEGRKRLDYLFERANLEHTIREICREELAKRAK